MCKSERPERWGEVLVLQFIAISSCRHCPCPGGWPRPVLSSPELPQPARDQAVGKGRKMTVSEVTNMTVWCPAAASLAGGLNPFFPLFFCFPNCQLKCHVHLKKLKKRFKIILKMKTMPDHLPLSSAESFAFTPVLNLRGDTNFTKTAVCFFRGGWGGIVLPLPQKGPHSCTLPGSGWSHNPSLSGSSIFSRVK